MQEQTPDTESPALFLEECRRRAGEAIVYQSFQLWSNAEKRPGDLRRTTSFHEAIEFLNDNLHGVLEVMFEWEIDGVVRQSEVEFSRIVYPTATEKFIVQMINALVLSKIAEALFKEKYPERQL